MESYSFRHFVPKEKEGTYYTVDFTVPQDAARVTVAYTYAQPVKGVLRDFLPTNVIDFGLMDGGGRFLGWSGSAHKSVFISEFESTHGYLCEPVRAGTWKILVGAYHVLPPGVEVTYTVTLEEACERLLFGDLHVHSTASDGKFDAYALGQMAKKRGLDFLGLANHNNFAENLRLPYIPGVTFVPAVEWTHYKGHMNFFGVAAPFENSFVANSEAEMRALVDAVRARGAVVSVNHPKCPICPYLWESDDAFDMVEIWNGPSRPTNLRGLAYWTGLLKAGRRLPAVGGSDYHRPGPFIRFGNPVTAVYAPSARSADILESLKAGRAFVTSGKSGPRLFLSYAGTKMGGEAAHVPGGLLHIEAAQLRGGRVWLVTDRGEQKLGRPRRGRFAADVPVEGARFAYIKVQTGAGGHALLHAVSNPIYFR